jgi:hypothetical protein
MKRVGGVALLLFAGALACGPDREAQLRSEIAGLKEARMERSAVEKSRDEANAAEAAAKQRSDELAAGQAKLAAREAEATRLQSAFDAEVKRNEELRSAIDAEQKQIERSAEAVGKLEQQVAEVTARALWARNQAAVFAKQLAIDDPGWAAERRVRAFDEFLTGLAKEFPDDALLIELAHPTQPVAAARASEVGARVHAAEIASRVRDHITSVYGLEANPEAARQTP